jgi:hypothetical protein
MTERPDLEIRVTARKDELIAELIEHKLNSSRSGAAGAIDTLKGRLSELALILKDGAVDGTTYVAPATRTRLDQWMAK